MTTNQYDGPGYQQPVLQGQAAVFTKEWYKFFVSLTQTVNNNTPSGDTATDAETLAVLQSLVGDAGLPQVQKLAAGALAMAFIEGLPDPLVAQALRRASDALGLTLGATPDPLVTQALRRGNDGIALAFLLAPALNTTAKSLNLGGGPSTQRPPNPPLYGYYFDTTLGQPIFVKQVTPSVEWVNASGFGPV